MNTQGWAAQEHGRTQAGCGTLGEGHVGGMGWVWGEAHFRGGM